MRCFTQVPGSRSLTVHRWLRPSRRILPLARCSGPPVNHTSPPPWHYCMRLRTARGPVDPTSPPPRRCCGSFTYSRKICHPVLRINRRRLGQAPPTSTSVDLRRRPIATPSPAAWPISLRGTECRRKKNPLIRFVQWTVLIILVYHTYPLPTWTPPGEAAKCRMKRG